MNPGRSHRDIGVAVNETGGPDGPGDLDSHDSVPGPMPSPGPSPDRIRILLIAANPLTTGRLAIDEEVRAIAEKLRLSNGRARFDLITCLAARPDDLLQYLNQHRPHIVHFSGHGSPAGELVLVGSGGIAQPVGTAALGELFRVLRDNVRVVLLNACYSATQAEAINANVDFVVGTRAPISDEAAIVFAAAFYSALGFGRTVRDAFAQAKAAVMVHGLAGHDVPDLRTRPGADLTPLYRDHGSDTSVEGAAMNPTSGPHQTGPAAVPNQHASTGGFNVGGNVNGNINVTHSTPAPPVRKGIGFDTKLLGAVVAADVAFFFYGMSAYTGRNTSAETWRAVIMLVMFAVTVRMIGRWLRRRA